jgi:hypothetical protein
MAAVLGESTTPVQEMAHLLQFGWKDELSNVEFGATFKVSSRIPCYCPFVYIPGALWMNITFIARNDFQQQAHIKVQNIVVNQSGTRNKTSQIIGRGYISAYTPPSNRSTPPTSLQTFVLATTTLATDLSLFAT